MDGSITMTTIAFAGVITAAQAFLFVQLAQLHGRVTRARQDAITDAICALETPSADRAAVILMIGLNATCQPNLESCPADESEYETGFALEALAALRPMLTGQIAADVADILDYPEKPWAARKWFMGG